MGGTKDSYIKGIATVNSTFSLKSGSGRLLGMRGCTQVYGAGYDRVHAGIRANMYRPIDVMTMLVKLNAPRMRAIPPRMHGVRPARYHHRREDGMILSHNSGVSECTVLSMWQG